MNRITIGSNDRILKSATRTLGECLGFYEMLGKLVDEIPSEGKMVYWEKKISNGSESYSIETKGLKHVSRKPILGLPRKPRTMISERSVDISLYPPELRALGNGRFEYHLKGNWYTSAGLKALEKTIPQYTQSIELYGPTPFDGQTPIIIGFNPTRYEERTSL